MTAETSYFRSSSTRPLSCLPVEAGIARAFLDLKAVDAQIEAAMEDLAARFAVDLAKTRPANPPPDDRKPALQLRVDRRWDKAAGPQGAFNGLRWKAIKSYYQKDATGANQRKTVYTSLAMKKGQEAEVALAKGRSKSYDIKTLLTLAPAWQRHMIVSYEAEAACLRALKETVYKCLMTRIGYENFLNLTIPRVERQAAAILK
ncbi:MAG: hypothetical protein E6Q76_07325 [Rhizobium sp.]|nr:MAG: hypothetical protein E6Q76_07325 [Rhizobium sp.]